MRNFHGNCVRLILGLAVLPFIAIPAHAQTAPYLLPYTISTAVGGGTSPKIGTACQGQTVAANAADTSGDGCLVTSTSIIMSASYSFDTAVDSLGNLYFVDGSSSSKDTVRKVEARSGLVHVFVGGSAKVCSALGATSYGDGCTANDGLANLTANYTISAGALGLYAAPNGDIYIAGGNNNVIHKVSAATGIMTVVAGYITGGSGAGGYNGDGGSALNAEMGSVLGVAVDAAGNIYIADSTNNVIRKVTASTGIITTIAGINPGNGGAAAATYTGDGGPATQATLFTPEDVEVDANGNVFEGEFGNKCVRVIYEGGAAVANLIVATNPTLTVAQVEANPGYIYSIVGNPAENGSTSSGKLGTAFKPGSLRKIALDARGNIYIADSGNEIIDFVDGVTGYERALAGVKGSKTAAGTGCATSTNPVLGDGCPATQATLSPGSSALGVSTDAAGNVYIDDGGNLRVRKVSTGQNFPVTAAGSSVTQNLWVHFGPGDTPAAAAPFTISSNSNGTVDYTLGTPACTSIGDTTDDCLIAVTFTPTSPGADPATLTVKTTLGATAYISLTGTAIAPAIALDPGTPSAVTSSLSAPAAMAQDGAGNNYVADTGNNRIVRYSTTGAATVIAGSGGTGYTGDGTAATLATFSGPKGVGVGQDGAVYVADTGNNAVRRIDPVTGIITTVAGGTVSANCSAALDSFGDGCPGTQVKLSAPAGVAVDTVGNVYISDTGNSIVRELTPSGYVFLTAGGAAAVCGSDPYGNGCAPTKATLKNPTALALDAQKDLFIADTGDSEIRELVAATGLITGVAGNGQAGPYGNAGPANAAELNAPSGVAVDAAGDIYIADTGNNAVRFINSSGNINTLVGILGVQGTGTLSNATSVYLNAPAAITSNGNGRLSVLDSGNGRLLSVNRTSTTFFFGSVNPNDSSPSLTLQETSTGSVASTLPSPLFSTVSGNTAFFPLTTSGSGACSAGSSLASASSCTFTAKFSPTATGPVTANYSATATDTSVPTISAPAVTLQFSGVGATLTRTTSANLLTTPATGNPPYGTAFNITTTITPAACASGATNCAITGTVTFFVDGIQVGSPVTVTSTTTGGIATGKAVGVINGATEGNHTVVAIYSGDANYQSSTTPSYAVAVAGAVTTTAVVPSATSLNQFQTLNLTATVSSSISSNFPTGLVNFYAGTTLLGQAGLKNGVASLLDSTITLADGTTVLPATLGLVPGTYNITAVYPGDTNFSPSTSAVVVVTVLPDAATISLIMETDPGTGIYIIGNSATVGTAQGSTVATNVLVTAANTVNDTLTFSCGNLPQYSVCTFQPTSLVYTASTGAPSQQLAQVTLWTDVAPVASVAGNTVHHTTVVASLLGWPLLLLSLAGLLGMRRKLLAARILAAVAALGILLGGSAVLNGCSSGIIKTVTLTPQGTYTVTLTVSGSHTPAQTVPIYFTVGPGIPGQE